VIFCAKLLLKINVLSFNYVIKLCFFGNLINYKLIYFVGKLLLFIKVIFGPASPTGTCDAKFENKINYEMHCKCLAKRYERVGSK
jgi:hypothetical protein